MEAILADLIKSISLEATKVLGPAIVASIATYKATKIQYELKLKEVEKNHEFGARRHLFEYYKSRQVKLTESYEKLSEALGQALGAAAYIEDSSKNINLFSTVSAFTEISKMYANIVPFEIDIALRDLTSKNLKETKEYEIISKQKIRLSSLQNSNDFESTKSNVFILLEIYSHLENTNQFILEKQMDNLFKKYTNA